MSMDDKDGVIWLDGEWLPWREAKVHVLTHTLHYGCGVFEGLRAYQTAKGPAIFRLRDHTDRLFRSAHIMKMEIPFDKDTLDQAHCEAISRNQLKSAYIRPMAFFGAEAMGLHAKGIKTHMMIAAWEWGKYLGSESEELGVDVCVSSWQRVAPNTLPALAKAAGNYLSSQLISYEAKRLGFAEGIGLAPDGSVSEGAGENLFVIRDNVIHTPGLAHSVLNGITRDTIMRLARDLGYDVRESTIPREMLYLADEIFMTGTAAEVTPVRSVDRLPVGDAKRGPITKALQEAFFGLFTGKTTDRYGWLEPVVSK
jgi:branched-chain amino acid aminotransferase